ncbi:hypothetical protein B0H63DRAFT_82881 [Podospora didyma]|uniref:FHA domain-containing protein n=1 Tax=Podospora didyma TaxID=330526 RepID=A0AAE0K006_9PEZI|nr:hypothetical protein B0H63DRAFT_82881 [Podospora didyma]
MWLLESELFQGRKLWLRPGKLYLFGRTASEPGLIAISDKTISRKHLTIDVGRVPDGGGRNLHARSKITIHDLDSKKGTLLNGVQIRGQKKVVTQDVNEVTLATKTFRIVWRPIVLSFSFTRKELRADPWEKLRESLEQLDIKYSAEYEQSTSHVVSKKRNTSKGLQALINGKYIVTDSFITAIIEAAIPDESEEGMLSDLERDFEGCWPNALDHLPPRGEEPVDRPPEAYSPDQRRQEVFDGYTFVFYEKKQYENLHSAITYGKGKALLKEAVPGETDVDGFVRYVKGVAGEKGLGSFEDGSEGKGVVVVRYTPAKEEETEWFAQFFTSFALRLDHRPIDQREFLEAILDCDASMLRRPLEVDSQPQPTAECNREDVSNEGDRMDVDQPQQQTTQEQARQELARESESAPPPRRGRRRGAASRFKVEFGFDDDADDVPIQHPPVLDAPAVESSIAQNARAAADSQDSLFVSQHQHMNHVEEEQEDQAPPANPQTGRKRPLSPLPELDDSALMDDIAPTAAAVKRRRLDAGETPVPPPPPLEPETAKDDETVPDSPPPEKELTKAQAAAKAREKAKKAKEAKEIEERERKEAEILVATERMELEDESELDHAAIRAGHQIEECEVHFPDPESHSRTRDKDIADGRWDPHWNGRKNFKRFRKQGEPAGRPAPRIIIGLEEVKPKEYGIGDDYWLENNESSSKRKKDTQSQNTQQQAAATSSKERPASRRTVIAMDSSDDEEEEDADVMEGDTFQPETELPRSRAAKAAEKANSLRSQSASQATQTRSQAGSSSRSAGKRAAADPAKERAAKRPRKVVQAKESESEEDSEDDLKFRFGKRA